MNKLNILCQEKLVSLGLDERYENRLNAELKEIDAQNEHDYFFDLYEKKEKYENENNLLVPYLLEIVDDFDIDKDSIYTYGDFPDVDQDVNCSELQSYLKNVWAPKTFGSDKVCNIGNYTRFGLKSSLQDMARVFGKSHSEIVALTTRLGLKDDDQKPLTWDKAMELYPDLNKYCEDNPEVADAAKRLLNRQRGMGKHAGGLIISSVPIDEFVPLAKDKEGLPISSWTEGLHDQDLGPMGLVKYDLLVITNLMQIALALKFIKERHNLLSICALPGQKDWSDTAYLNDPKAIGMANRGELKCIFQFDADGIRKMTKEGGVTCFDDIVAYTSLYRPAAIQVKMHERYIKRKRGEESYEIHPLLKPYLEKTYNVLVFQEQTMQVLNVVGNIPLKDCEILRKAISKKNESYFAKYKDMFVDNGMSNLSWEKEKVLDLWNQLCAFSSYAFNLSHATAYSYISSRLLYLKAHYPLEFFAAVLACEDAAEKIKEYKTEAKKYNIEIMPIDINKSNVKFSIIDNKIYFGISNIKGIGEEKAKRIVDNRPYENLSDFLEKFGTEAGVVKPLIGLGVFGDEKITLFKQYEEVKLIKKKKIDKEKRFIKSVENKSNLLKTKLPWQDLAEFTQDNLQEIERRYEEAARKHLAEEELSAEVKEFVTPWQDDGKMHENINYIRKLFKAYDKTMTNYERPKEYTTKEIEVNNELKKMFSCPEECEKEYYGFIWTHPLEKNENYEGMTFDSFRNDDLLNGPIEILITKVEKKESKKGNTYYLLTVEDGNSEKQFIQVWVDDYERFQEEIKKNTMLRMRVTPPSGGFNRWTMESPLKHLRYKLPKDKTLDSRIILL